VRSYPVCIDFGSSHIRISLPQEGVEIEEPAIALVSEDGDLVSYGTQAEAVIGKAPLGVREESLIQRGGVANYDLLISVLKDLFKRRARLPILSKKVWVLSSVLGINSIQKRVLIDLADQMKADGVYWIPSIVASLMGFAQKPVMDQGWLVVQSGHTITDLGITAFGGIVKGQTLEEAGQIVNQQIARYVNRTFHIHLGEEQTERIKRAILMDGETIELEVHGRESVSGIPKTCMIRNEEIQEAVKPIRNRWLHHLKRLLEDTPAQLSSDIMTNGILLSGGNGALGFAGGKDRFSIPMHTPEDPQHLVIQGLGLWANSFPNEMARIFEWYSL